MQDIHTANARVSGLAARLWRTRAVVWAIMVLERLWPLLLPLVVIASLFLSFSWLGIFRLLPDMGRFALLGLLGLGALAALIPFRNFRMPLAAEIDRRIEGSNKLEHA